MQQHILMCAPDNFDVAYVINPWMQGNLALCDATLAMRQWQELSRAIGRVAQVETVRGPAGVPDMVFTANAGLMLNGRVVLSHFKHAERQPEEPLFANWFEEHGFPVMRLPEGLHFEGAGDALFDHGQALLWMGWGHRSDLDAAPRLSRMLNVEVQPLRLVNPRFYHLDTCFCPLQGGQLLYYPDAFDAPSRARIEARIAADKRIVVARADAEAFACNAVNIGSHIFVNQASPALQGALEAHGYQMHNVPLSEFMKAGGAAKCLTLNLSETLSPQAAPDSDGGASLLQA
jgi:N-dimethylarginine dimethylaminohydrolase